MVELLGGGLPEREHLDTLRVDPRHHVLDRRVLAGGVHRLEDDEQRVAVARPQQLLRIGELIDPACQCVLGPLVELANGEVSEVRAALPTRVSSRDPCGRARLDEQLLEDSTANGLARLH